MNEIDANQQGLKNFVVLYREPEQAVLDAPRGFQCWAEDGDHAEEQCSNAWPDADVVWVWQGPFGVGVQPALDDYYTTWLAGEVEAARNPRLNAPADSGMVEVLVHQLDEHALDWVVQQCEGLLTPDGRLTDAYCDSLGHDSDGGFSTDWAQGGPILEREGIWVIERYKGVWDAFKKIPWENRWKGVQKDTAAVVVTEHTTMYAKRPFKRPLPDFQQVANFIHFLGGLFAAQRVLLGLLKPHALFVIESRDRKTGHRNRFVAPCQSFNVSARAQNCIGVILCQ